MSELGQEIRQALRWLLHNPRVSLMAVVTIAIGIGPCTAVFSVVNGVVLRSLPFQDPERLVCLWSRTAALLTALLACLFPALRAARTDPQAALRNE